MVAAENESTAPVRVAVVDDHRLIVDGLTAVLERCDGLTVEASAASWAELMAHPALPVDVAVVDLHLDDGILIGAKIRALRAMGSSVVVISRHFDSASVNSALQAGALAFVAKADAAAELIDAVRSAAAGEPHRSSRRDTAEVGAGVQEAAGLGGREERALVLYAGGLSFAETAEQMATTVETVKSYIKRARRKYRGVGVELGTRAALRDHARRQGWLAEP
jgi:two-component system, NarL family, uhpT operon response regulator UhpA